MSNGKASAPRAIAATALALVCVVGPNARAELRAVEDGQPIRGLVRYETTTDAPADALPLSRREGHGSYAPTRRGETEGVLTWRMREADARVPIPRGQWSLERVPIPTGAAGVPGT